MMPSTAEIKYTQTADLVEQDVRRWYELSYPESRVSISLFKERTILYLKGLPNLKGCPELI